MKKITISKKSAAIELKNKKEKRSLDILTTTDPWGKTADLLS